MGSVIWARTVLLGLALLLPHQSIASAATAFVDERDCGKGGCGYEPVFNAAPGEDNRVTVSDEGDGAILFTDEGAIVTPGRDCVGVDEHAVRCSATRYTSIACCAEINLGDGNDLLGGPSRRALYVTAGTGDDTVRAAGYAVIDGGGGRDLLEAESGAMSDGDDGSAERPFDADSMRVADGHGGLVYETRTTPVTVDLHAGSGGGAGENDQIAGFRTVRAGAGDDELRAGDEPVTFLGAGGDDTLIGSPWKDHLYGEAGRDKLDGGSGDDTLRPGRVAALGGQTPLDGARDLIACGAGNDLIEKSAGDEIAGDCERVDLVGLSGGFSDAFRLNLPVSRPSALLVARTNPCRVPEVETLSIRMERAVERYPAGTLLGRKVTRCKPGLAESIKAGLHLSKRGQRLLKATPEALPVVVKASYTSLSVGTRTATFYARLR